MARTSRKKVARKPGKTAVRKASAKRAGGKSMRKAAAAHKPTPKVIGSINEAFTKSQTLNHIAEEAGVSRKQVAMMFDSLTNLISHHMNNKVVTTLVKAFDQLGMPTVRFNFRGVGQSAGSYGEAIGESEDLLAVVQWVQRELPDHTLWLAGFSFGSYVAARVANQMSSVQQLISIAPPVDRADFAALTQVQSPWLVVQGDADEVVSAASVIAWAENHTPKPELVVWPGVGHFFHGKLIELRELLVQHFQ